MDDQHSVTIKDIAQRLKLSPSTVSRALRGGTEIREETRRLIQEVAREMHYSPNPIALSLKEKKSKIIGVIVPEIANNFCSATIAGIEEVAYSRGYHVIIFQSHELYEREVTSIQLLTSRRIDGLILTISNETRNYDHLQALRGKGIPLVMFDRVCEEIKTHKVVVNDYQGAFDATCHLIREGFTRIAHVAIAPYLSITQNRLKGYEEALRSHHLPVKKNWIVHCDFDAMSIEKAVRQLFEGSERPDAIVASTERLAIGCIKVLREMKLRIPMDVALVGFSDNPLNKFMAPSLTAVQQPTFDIGQKSAELLIELIESKTPPKNYRTIEMKTTLDIQDSSRNLTG
ncbi:LacI family DNA-binding transcriptional regulator [Compostibacter hankyongensis]|uniref:LacI family DNA-binding transcriptional regulator n=1 Tax=Compostibacter hankyongensis TaxID=1007089 RepID=A0ABP8FIP4_9BACT